MERARRAGVSHIVVPTVWPDDFAAAWDVADRAGPVRCHVALGLHPQALPDSPADQDHLALDALRQACAARRPAALGECGLDYRVDLEAAPRERQRHVLRDHLLLANALRLPVLLHCLAAHNDLAALIDDVGGLPAGGVMHAFSGSAEQVDLFVKRGLCLSFAGPVTWPGARKPTRAAAACPGWALLCETDAPDQTPHPYRGTRNEPAYLPLVVEALARARGEGVGETARLCTENARRVLGFTAGGAP
jgi:TatD DNase family protein